MSLTSGVNGSMLEVACISPNAELSCVLFPKQNASLKPAAVQPVNLREDSFLLTVSTCLSTVPSAKNSGFLVSTTIRSKKERQDSF